MKQQGTASFCGVLSVFRDFYTAPFHMVMHKKPPFSKRRRRLWVFVVFTG